VIWVGAEQENFLLWDSTAAITPNLGRRAVDFFLDVIRRREGKRKLVLSGKSVRSGQANGSELDTDAVARPDRADPIFQSF